jgi:hypothetical protein
MGLSFTIAAGPRQRSHSRVRIPRNSWQSFPLSDSKLPQPGGPGVRIYIPQELGDPIIPPGTEFPFCRLLWLTGLRWTCSTPSNRKHRFHRYPINTSIVACLFVAARTCLLRHCLAMNVYSGSAIPFFQASRHSMISLSKKIFFGLSIFSTNFI